MSPSIIEGLTYAADETSRAPEAPLDPEQVRETQRIREQSQTARETPSDDGFNKEAIAAAFADNSTSIQGGIETADELEAKRIADAYERFNESELGQRIDADLAQEKEDLALGRAARRVNEVVGPALEVLGSSWDDSARASAWVTLSPAERELAFTQGLVDEEEAAHLVQVGAKVLDSRQRAHGEMAAALSDMEQTEDRLSRWTQIRSEFGLLDDRDAADVLMHIAARVEQDSDGRLTLGSLPGPAWEAAARAVIAQENDVLRAEETRSFKQRILDEDLGDVASGLTEGGRPARERVVLAPRFRPAEATAKALARGRVETDEQIKDSVRYGHEPTSVALNVVEGDNRVPEATQRKMAALFGNY